MITTYFQNLVMDNVFNTGEATPLPTEYHLAMSLVIPENDGVGAELLEPSEETGYTRIQLTNLAKSVDGLIVNESDISFNRSTADQGVIKAYGVFDAATGGNLLIYNPLVSPRTIEEATILTIKAGELKFTFNGV